MSSKPPLTAFISYMDSWLNLVESFFSSPVRTLLRWVRVHSKAELKEHIQQYIDCINADPVVY